MRILKTHVLLRLLNSYVVDSPQPANITYLWNFGSLLAVCLIIQILTGAFLAMHYTPNVDLAFNSVEHIMRDVNNGWIIRYTHANVASFFFIFVYMHIGRGLYYSSYKTPRVLVWSIGVIILVLMMAIGFLGYYHSPKWHKLFSNISLYNISSFLTNDIFINIFLLVFFFSFILAYLDNFRLSHISIIRYVQIISFISAPFIILLSAYDNIIFIDLINNIKDNDSNTINLHGHGHIIVDKEASKAIGQGLNTIGSQIGLGASIVGVGGAVGKAIAKSSLPPVQKAGVIVGGALISGFGHSVITAVNRNTISANSANIVATATSVTSNTAATSSAATSTGATISSGDIISHISKFTDDSNISPMQELLFDIYGINATCLSLILILIIQIIFKLYLNNNIKLNLVNILGIKFNTNLEYYINKIILFNKKMSVIYIWLILIILVIGISLSIYASYDLYNNIDAYVNVHINFKNK
jgi:hypothetical protein